MSTSPRTESPPAPELTKLDPRGDVIFLVGCAFGDETPARRFRVCSRTMARVSPVFDRMLHGNFSESKPGSETHSSASGTPGASDWVVKLPDDRPDTFMIFLSIAHGRFRGVPKVLSIDSFYELTALTHYYDATPLLAPWLHRWVSGIGEAPTSSGGEGRLGLPKVLWISWVVGHKQLFEGTARRLVMESEGGLFGEESGLLDLNMPPDIIERIAEIRTQTIQSIMEIFGDLIAKLIVVDEGPRWCRHASYMGPHRCESMILGSMTFCLTRAGLWPIPEAEDVEESVLALYSTLMNLVIHDIGRPEEKGGVDHAECNPRGFLMGRIKRVLGDIPSPVGELHVEQLDRQIERLLV
ncbi:hypothetical protein CCHL11_06489 [Colletotrichum chlorophyti]|uniref:BTB domain-containing protein n=1 Tax=Colletotrichum chlorophyti TaxID=708187 RepID=A0A1Q8RRU1_9PEZI|nr:hypothetical protein CCHL11_06489 [Colletotrichum chlorophyti]